VGFDSDKAVLEIEFHTGSIYQYFGVPESEFQAPIGAKSKGAYFSMRIKNRYRFERVG
jgi:hypothetical protein